ncbi:MAG: hypothetical protein IJD83_03790 [Clostridia bacterium]|nr:hypothetical protein [Clostridia bacterium]
MTKKTTPEKVKEDIVSRSLSMILQRLSFSKKNTKQLLALIEKIESDTDLTATEKKLLIGKINSYYLISTAELLNIVNELAATAEEASLPEQVRITMADEVEKWAM